MESMIDPTDNKNLPVEAKNSVKITEEEGQPANSGVRSLR